MKNLEEGKLRRVVVDESDSDVDDNVSLGGLSDEDLQDSEEEASNASMSDVEEDAIEKDLADIPFGTLVQAQAGLSTKDSSKAQSRSSISSRVGKHATDRSDDNEPKSKLLKRKRDNKHAPTEMSSKKPVGRRREAVEVAKIERRDPRFDPDMTTKTPASNNNKTRAYGFLEDYRKDEIRMLKQSIAKEKNVQEKARLEKTLASMQSREKAARERERRERVLSDYKRKEREAAKDGKVPYYLKESEKNKLYLKDKFDSMKDTKALSKFMEKKRKRRSQKDRKRALPT